MGSTNDHNLNSNPKSESSFRNNKGRNKINEIDFWFLRSIINTKDDYIRNNKRSITFQDEISYEEIQSDEHCRNIKEIVFLLGKFFPIKWLLEIQALLLRINLDKLDIQTKKEQIGFFLGYIEFYLNFRGLTLFNSTLNEINLFSNVIISEKDIRNWQLRILGFSSRIRVEWKKINEQKQKSILISTIINVINKEIRLNEFTKEDIFKFKQETIFLAQKFGKTEKAIYLKNPEVWARKICFKVFRKLFPNHSLNIFSQIQSNNNKKIDNKYLQMNKMTY